MPLILRALSFFPAPFREKNREREKKRIKKKGEGSHSPLPRQCLHRTALSHGVSREHFSNTRRPFALSRLSSRSQWQSGRRECVRRWQTKSSRGERRERSRRRGIVRKTMRLFLANVEGRASRASIRRRESGAGARFRNQHASRSRLFHGRDALWPLPVVNPRLIYCTTARVSSRLPSRRCNSQPGEGPEPFCPTFDPFYVYLRRIGFSSLIMDVNPVSLRPCSVGKCCRVYQLARLQGGKCYAAKCSPILRQRNPVGTG